VYQAAYGGLSLPVSEAAGHEVLSLPIYPQLTDEQIRYAADSLRACL
jgi:dTDP-4-amino-4,6-dideoxygalactose transaminase